MKNYIHARLSKEDRTVLADLKRVTGRSESDLVRRGLRLVLAEFEKPPTAIELAGDSVGKFKNGPADLSSNKGHLDGFGE